MTVVCCVRADLYSGVLHLYTSPPWVILTKLVYIFSRGIMRHPQNIRIGLLLAVIGMVAIPDNAHAYLDPGTGSVVLQVVIAGFLGALFTFKSYVRAAVSAVSRLFGKKDNASDA